MNKNYYSRYSESSIGRSLTTLIPFIGTSIDIFVTNKASEIQNKRMNDYFEILNKKIENITLVNKNNEEMYDIFLKTSSGAMKTRLADKRKYYSELFKKNLTIENSNENSRIELMIQILDSLEEIHLNILKFSYEEDKVHKEISMFQKDSNSNIKSYFKTDSDENINIADMATLTMLVNGLLLVGKNGGTRPYGSYKLSNLGLEFTKWILS